MSTKQKKEKALKKLREITFSKKEKVCPYLFEYKDSDLRLNLNVYPFFIEFFDDCYHLYWYCDKSVEQYGLPKGGLYVYDPGEDWNKDVSELDGFCLNHNEDDPPFYEFLKIAEQNVLPAQKFKKLFSVPEFNDPLKAYPNILKLPFGVTRMTR